MPDTEVQIAEQVYELPKPADWDEEWKVHYSISVIDEKVIYLVVVGFEPIGAIEAFEVELADMGDSTDVAMRLYDGAVSVGHRHMRLSHVRSDVVRLISSVIMEQLDAEIHAHPDRWVKVQNQAIDRRLEELKEERHAIRVAEDRNREELRSFEVKHAAYLQRDIYHLEGGHIEWHFGMGSIREACEEAASIAATLGSPVHFTFNDIPIVVAPGDDADVGVAQWVKAREHEDRR